MQKQQLPFSMFLFLLLPDSGNGCWDEKVWQTFTGQEKIKLFLRGVGRAHKSGFLYLIYSSKQAAEAPFRMLALG